ncbi:Protein dennd6a [Branchiostoma belcheri]|nr:Protein dennd6a [Branchiostoma belcheri]
MISPLSFCSDFRPYFTIHDSEFKEYTTKTQAPPPVVLGVTNPFFAKTLQHWPHIIRIGEMGNIVAGGRQVLKTKKSSSLKTIDAKPGNLAGFEPGTFEFCAEHSVVMPYTPTFRTTGIASRRPNEVQTAMLKRYLLELTQSFMIPLERYVASLMPLQRNVSPWKQAPRLKPFEPEEFLKTVEHSGPQLTSGLRGDWEGLYRRFFRSSNFEGWLRARQQEVDDKLQALHLEALCDADLSLWIQGRPEVEVVDLVLKLREKMKFAASNRVCVKEEVLQRLTLHLDGIIRALPEDLRSILKTCAPSSSHPNNNYHPQVILTTTIILTLPEDLHAILNHPNNNYRPHPQVILTTTTSSPCLRTCAPSSSHPNNNYHPHPQVILTTTTSSPCLRTSTPSSSHPNNNYHPQVILTTTTSSPCLRTCAPSSSRPNNNTSPATTSKHLNTVRILIEVCTPDLGLVGDKYSFMSETYARPNTKCAEHFFNTARPIDPWRATIIQAENWAEYLGVELAEQSGPVGVHLAGIFTSYWLCTSPPPGKYRTVPKIIYRCAARTMLPPPHTKGQKFTLF